MTTSTRCNAEFSKSEYLELDRWELIRALGAVVTTPPPGNSHARAALNLPAETRVEHTDAFVLSLPPHAAIYLGAEGQLGGAALDRVGGFWRALGLRAPEDADHLGVLLMLYAELGVAEIGRRDERGRKQMRRARSALFSEHISSWAPGYLTALGRLGIASAATWAHLVADALSVESAELTQPDAMPAALREAPRAIATGDSFDELLNSIVSPVRSGILLTQRDLAAAARRVGVGFRRGERRFALEAMLRQNAHGTLTCLADHARSWVGWHQAASWVPNIGTPARRNSTSTAWWVARARRTADVLESLAAAAASGHGT